jgi:hypothetical protein
VRHLTRILLAASLLAVAAGAAAGPPRFPPPPKSHVGLLGEDMVFNGIPMEMRQFTTSLSVEEVERFYGELWPRGTEERPGYVITDAMAPWKIISRVENGYLMTVQVTGDGAGSRGFLAISRMPDPDAEVELGEGFPLMRGTKPLNDVRTRDIGKDGRTMAFVNDHTTEANAGFYRTWFTSRGWTVDMDRAPADGAYVLSFRDGSRSVNIVINDRAGRTYIVAQTTNFDKKW